VRPGAPLRAGLAAAALAGTVLAAGCADEAGASLARGDRLVGTGDLSAAIAEYRLARRQQGDAPEVLLRLAHAYAQRGEVSTTAELYARLLEQDSTYRHQAAADLVGVARKGLERGGPDRMARALEPVLELGSPSLVPRDLRLELARHYSDRQEFTRALPLYLSVIQEDPDVSPGVRYGLARAYEELGGCREALPHFDAYLQAMEETETDTGGVRWHYGSCLYEVARSDRERGRTGDALERVERLIDLGRPRTLMDRAQYLRGEMLLAQGRDQEALEAYREVLRLNPTLSDPLARSAEEKVRQIQYGYR